LKLKPPALRSGKLRGLIAVGVIAAGAGSLVLQSTPAMADPISQYVVVGSDTVQDVYNQFAADFGSLTVNGISASEIGSQNATNPVTQTVGEDITPTDGNAFGALTTLSSGGASCAFVRPNGSGPGVAALEYSMGDLTQAANLTTGNAGQTDAPAAGCVDIARSSSATPVIAGQATPATNPANQAIQLIPFAVDAVTGSTGPASGASGTIPTDVNGTTVNAPVVNTTLANIADNLTDTELTQLYNTCTTTPVTVGSTTVQVWPFEQGVTQPGGTQRIDLYVPQLGSGTEKFWAKKTGGWTATSPKACVFHTIQAGDLADPAQVSGAQGPAGGFAVEEHDGTAVSTDQFGYGPFSIAQYFAQSVHHIDSRFHAAVLHSIDGVTPFNAQGTLNTAFPFQREVYSVVEQSRITGTIPVMNGSVQVGTAPNPTDPFTPNNEDQNLINLMVGSSSAICSDKAEIKFYGFALFSSGNTGTSPGDLCGEVLASNSENF
jgi:hypothetical protein